MTPLLYDYLTNCIEIFLSNASSNNEKTYKRIHQGEIRAATSSGGLLSTIFLNVSPTATKTSQTT